jgi:hypothetical protein
MKNIIIIAVMLLAFTSCKKNRQTYCHTLGEFYNTNPIKAIDPNNELAIRSIHYYVHGCNLFGVKVLHGENKELYVKMTIDHKFIN